MKNKKSKISFDRSELNQFVNNSELVIKESLLNRISGGEPSYEQKAYAESVGVYSQIVQPYLNFYAKFLP